MSFNVLILGASYGSLLSTKLLMAGHNTTLVCLPEEADLINKEGTIVRITRRGASEPDLIHSSELPGKVKGITPENVNPSDYDMIGMAMQEPQYRAQAVWDLLKRIAASGKPCLSIMNMPPLVYLKRIPGLDTEPLRSCYTEPRVWDDFDPDNFTLCSPDPQAFRPPEEKLNFLHVGLPTNFKASKFAKPQHNTILNTLADDIMAARYKGNEIPVKLKVHKSLFIPMAKWSMLLTGNYRAITEGDPRSIKEAVHGDLSLSEEIYSWVDRVVQTMGAAKEDQVPFEKYANAANSLLKPSSAARAVFAGAKSIERVDKLVQAIAGNFNLSYQSVDENVKLVDRKIEENNRD